jgi:hypothetical protein
VAQGRQNDLAAEYFQADRFLVCAPIYVRVFLLSAGPAAMRGQEADEYRDKAFK